MAQMPEAIILRKTEETKTGVTYCVADVKTNADRIRNMDDYDLAIFLENVSCKHADTESWLDWLKQEVE